MIDLDGHYFHTFSFTKVPPQPAVLFINYMKKMKMKCMKLCSFMGVIPSLNASWNIKVAFPFTIYTSMTHLIRYQSIGLMSYYGSLHG